MSAAGRPRKFSSEQADQDQPKTENPKKVMP
jgi:hypothetical protein